MFILVVSAATTSMSIRLELLSVVNIVPKSSTLDAEAIIVWLSPTPNSNGKKLEV